MDLSDSNNYSSAESHKKNGYLIHYQQYTADISFDDAKESSSEFVVTDRNTAAIVNSTEELKKVADEYGSKEYKEITDADGNHPDSISSVFEKYSEEFFDGGTLAVVYIEEEVKRGTDIHVNSINKTEKSFVFDLSYDLADTKEIEHIKKLIFVSMEKTEYNEETILFE